MTTQDLITTIETELGGELTAQQQYEIKAIVGANPIDQKIYNLVVEHVLETFCGSLS